MPRDTHGTLVDSVIHECHVFVVMVLDFEIDGSRHGHPRIVDPVPYFDQEMLLHFQPHVPRNSHLTFVDLNYLIVREYQNPPKD